MNALGNRIALVALVGALGVSGIAYGQFVVEREGEHYHRMSCPLLQEMEIEDMLIVRSFLAATRYGKEPCPNCKPPVSETRRRVVTLRPHIHYMADLRQRVYHRLTCRRAQGLSDSHSRAISSHDEAERYRLRPCDLCNPPSLQQLKEMEPDEFDDGDAAVPELTVRVRRTLSQLVTVPADTERVDTGIEVEKGHFVLFRATGKIQTGSSLDPDGPPPVSGPGGAIVDGKKRYCLMARIGGQVYEVGRERGIQAEEAGRLFLGILDEEDGFKDNSGAFQVWVRVFEEVEEEGGD